MTTLDTNKPHRGRIYAWRMVDHETHQCVTGVFTNYEDRHMTTSRVEKHEGNEIETRNSRYTLVGNEGDPLPDTRHGPWRLLIERSIRGEVMAAAGTIVHYFSGHDFGLTRDDSRMTGLEHVSVTLSANGDAPFFTVPTCILRGALP